MAPIKGHVISGRLMKDMKILLGEKFKRLYFITIATMLLIQVSVSFADNKDVDFLKAALTGDIATVEKLLKEDIKIDLQNPDGFTALAVAAQNGHAAVVNLLLKNNAAVDLQNVQGGTALLLAAKNGHADIVDALLAKGANPDLQNKNGLSPLMVASALGHTAIVNTLLAKGANPNLQDEAQTTAISATTGVTDTPLCSIC